MDNFNHTIGANQLISKMITESLKTLSNELLEPHQIIFIFMLLCGDKKPTEWLSDVNYLYIPSKET